jgi:hypothetical protein
VVETGLEEEIGPTDGPLEQVALTASPCLVFDGVEAEQMRG